MKTKNSRKVLTVFFAVMLVMSLSLIGLFAETTGTVKEISTVDQLVDAIKNQKDGETWNLAAGTYDIADKCIDVEANIAINGTTYSNGFVFPIFANNLKIIGNGDVTITSSYDPNSGIEVKQNFVTVSGQNVTIENVNLKGNPNSAYDGLCNKVLLLADDGKDLTLKKVNNLPLKDNDNKLGSGSIYFIAKDAGETLLEDVTLSSWISARAVTTGTVTAKNIVIDFADNAYSGYNQDGNYAWKPGISGDKVTLDGLTIKVDGDIELVKQVIDGLKPGTTIELTEDIELSEELYIKGVDNVTIKGNGHTITAAEDFKMNIEGQIQLVKVESAENVTLDNVKLVGTDKTKHTLDVYGATNLTLNNVTLNHENASDGAPLINNGSSISVTGTLEIITGNKSWYGINLDNKSGEAYLTFEEESNLTFTDNSDAADKRVAKIDKSDAEGKDPVLESKSENLVFEKKENGFIDTHTEHTGGTATCKDKAVCTVCGKSYGELDPQNHTGETEIKNAKDATCTAEGYTGDKVCKDCGVTLEAGKAIEKTAHTYKDGVCTVCGAKENPETADSLLTVCVVLMLACSAAVTGLAIYGKKKAN